MNIAELARRARLSENAARTAVRDLEQLGEVSVTDRRAGRGGGCSYVVTASWVTNPPRSGGFTAGNPTGSGGFHAETPQDLEGSNPTGSGGFAESGMSKPQVGTPNSPESGGFQISGALDCSVVSGKRSKSKAVSEVPRADVDRLCDHLADKIAERGSSRPKIGKRWKDSARLMIDSDGRTEDQIRAAIDYSQQHHFWHRNIMSMEKLRAQYDRLRLDWIAENDKKSGHKSKQQETDELFDDAMRRAKEMDAQNEAG